MEMMEFLEADREQLMSGLVSAGTPEQAQRVVSYIDDGVFDGFGRTAYRYGIVGSVKMYFDIFRKHIRKY